MVVMTPREKWTDERLDDLNKKVDRGFERTKAAIAETKVEVKELRREMHAGFARVDGRLDKLNDRFDRLSQILIGGTIAIIVTLIGSNTL